MAADLATSELLALENVAIVTAEAVAGETEQQSALRERGASLIHWEGRDVYALTNQWLIQFDDEQTLDLGGIDASALASQVHSARRLSDGLLLIETTGADYASLESALGSVVPGAKLEPNFVVWAGVMPNDTQFSNMWALNNTGQTGGTVDADIDAPEAWDITTGDGSVVVAVIDTGIDYTHPDLVSNIWINAGEIAGDGIDNDTNGYIDDIHGWDFVNDDGNPMDDDGHGTHVAGTIDARGNNALGVSGVAPNVKLMALKFLDSEGFGYVSDAVSAVNYATMMKRDHGVNVVATNNSWGGGSFSQALYDAISAANTQDILFVAAAGNDGRDNYYYASYPANYDLPNVISVASTDHNDELSWFSNYGANVDLAAPGESILSTLPGGGYGTLSGTSMATPHVAGAVALLKMAEPGLTGAQIKARLLAQSDEVLPYTVSPAQGYVMTGGRLNLASALDPQSGVHLRATQATIAGGNGDHFANPGETITFSPTLLNRGETAATGVTVAIRSLHAGVTVVGPATKSYGTLNPFYFVTQGNAFQLQIDAGLADMTEVQVELTLTSAEGGTEVQVLSFSVLKLTSAAETTVNFVVSATVADPVRNIVYVVDRTHRKLLAIDTELGRTIAHVDLAADPILGSITTSLNGDRVFVALQGSQQIQVFKTNFPDGGFEPLALYSVPYFPTYLAFGSGNRLIASFNHKINLLDADTGAILGTEGTALANNSFPDDPMLDTSPDGNTLYAAHGLYGVPYSEINSYDISHTGAPAGLETYHNAVPALFRDFKVDSANGRLLMASSAPPYDLETIDLESGDSRFWSVAAAYPNSIDFHPDQNVVYVGTGDPYAGTIRRFNRTTGEILGDFIPSMRRIEEGMLEATAGGQALYVTLPGSTEIASRIGVIGVSSLVIDGVPLAKFSVSASSGAPALSVNFDAAASVDFELGGQIASYSWDFGDGTTATGAQAQHTYSQNGTYRVRLRVTDSSGQYDDAWRTIGVSNPPTAASQSLSVPEDGQLVVQLAGTDPDNDSLTFEILTPPTHGSLTVNGAVASYTPAANYNGPDSFSYRASDGRTTSTPATVTINVTSVNDAPLAKDDVFTTAVNAPVSTLDVRGNDKDVDDATLTITGVTAASHGTVVSHGDGTFTYTPEAGYIGFDSFEYTVTDAQGLSDTATVTVAISTAILDGDWETLGGGAGHTGYFGGVVGSAALALEWSAVVSNMALAEPAVADGKIFAMIREGTTFYIEARDEVTHAVLWRSNVSAVGVGTYSPLTYADGVVYVHRNYNPGTGNSEPSAVWAIDAEDGSLIWKHYLGEQWTTHLAPTVADGVVWVASLYYNGLYGIKVADGTRHFLHTLPQQNGWTPTVADGKVYTWVKGTLTQWHAANGSLDWQLQLGNSQNGTTGTVTAVDGTLYVNQYYSSSDPPRLYAIDSATHQVKWQLDQAFGGTASVSGGVVYMRGTNTVTAIDAANGQVLRTFNVPSVTGSLIVTDDALIAASTSATYVFQRNTGALLHQLGIGGNLSLANDRLYVATSAGELLAFRFSNELNGQPIGAADAFSTNEDTQATLNVLANDSDPDSDPLTLVSVTTPAHGTATILANGTIRYTPVANYFGADSFTYTLRDARYGTATATVSLTINSVNDAPVSQAATFIVRTSTPAPITVAATDVESDPLTYSIVSNPATGSLTGTGPNWTYTPATGFAGLVTFTYRTFDGQAYSNTATVTIRVNDPPVANSGSVQANESQALTFTPPASDPNNNPLTAIIVSAPSHGTAVASGGNIIYTPVTGYIGPDSFTYRVSDGVEQSGVATINVTVIDVNSAPLAVDDNWATKVGVATTTAAVVNNDIDAEGDFLNVVSFTNAAHGTLVLNPNNSFTYTPDAGYTGIDQFTYTIGDGSGLTDVGLMTISVGDGNLAGNWTMAGEDAAHTGTFAGSLLGTQVSEKWVVTVDTVAVRQVVVAEGQVFLTTDRYSLADNYVIALNGTTGAETWRRLFAPNGSTLGNRLHAPAYSNGKLIVQHSNHNTDTQVWALNPQTGGTIWSLNQSSQFPNYLAPTIDNGTIYVNSGSYGGLLAINEANGTQKFFQSPTVMQNIDQWSATVSGGRLFTYMDGDLREHDITTGAILWTTAVSTYGSGGRIAAIEGNFAYVTTQAVGAGSSGLQAVNLTTRAVAWQAAGQFVGSPAVSGGTVYALQGNNVLAFNATTGALQMTFAGDSALAGQPIVTDDAILVASATKTYLFQRSNGALLTIIPHGGILSLADNTLYIAKANGELRAYALTTPAATSDTLPQAVISDVTLNEGNSGTTLANFVVQLSSTPTQDVVIDYATASGTATADSDFVAKTGQLIIPAGQRRGVISIEVIGDTRNGVNEKFTVNLISANGAALVDNQGTGTINNDDAVPTLKILDTQVLEGNSGTVPAVFTVQLSQASERDVSVYYNTAYGNATAPTDFTTTGGLLTIAAGQTTGTIAVPVLGEALNEFDETFYVNLVTPTNATIADSQGLGTIVNDDPLPSLSINDVQVTEGNTGSLLMTFTITLSVASGRTLTVNYSTASLTATASSDFTPSSATITFSPGQLTRTFTVPILGDTISEGNEIFFVNLSTPVWATISDGQGIGKIIDNEAAPANLSPVVLDAAFASIEHPANGTVIGAIFSTDPNPSTTLTWSIVSGNTGGAFSVDGAGQLVVANSTAINFESTPVFNLVVKATDPGGLNDTAAITVTLSDRNDAPHIGEQTFSVPENSAAGTVVGTVVAGDPDQGTFAGPLTYWIVGGATQALAIDSATGVLTVANSAWFNYEQQPTLSVTVETRDPSGLTASAVMTIQVTNVAEPSVVQPGSGSVAENAANGTVVGMIVASDPDADPLSLSITAGNTGGAFSINGLGQIVVANAAALNYEVQSSYDLTITVNDGIFTSSAVFTVSVLDINETPNLSNQTFTLNENSVAGTLLGTVVASDPDFDPLTYAITAGNTSGAFSINSATGELYVANAAALDFETTPVFNLTVRVTDDGTPTLNRTATITVNLNNVTVPAPWTTADIGAVAATGMAELDQGVFTVKGSGVDIWGTSDEFRFVYQRLTGNGEIIARVDSLTNTNSWAKAGVMIRDTLATNSKEVAMFDSYSQGTTFQYRSSTGGSSANKASTGAAPIWVRLVRNGNTLTGYKSTNGTTWTQVGTVNVTMASTVYIGLAVTSHNDGVLTTARFSNVQLTGVLSGASIAGASVSGASISGASSTAPAATTTPVSSATSIPLLDSRSLDRPALSEGLRKLGAAIDKLEQEIALRAEQSNEVKRRDAKRSKLVLDGLLGDLWND